MCRILPILLFSHLAWASTPLYVALGGGQSTGAHTDSQSSSILLTGGSVSSSTDDLDSSYGEVEIGVRDLTRMYSLVYGTFDYTYKSGPPNDKTQSFILLSKFAHNLPDINSKIWIGVGVGLALTTLGETSTTFGSNTITVQDSSQSSLLLHGRVGIDHYLSEKFFSSLSLAYSHTNPSFVSNVSQTSTGNFVGQINTDLTRTWWNWIVSIGIRL